jgi:hypothetical protein
MSTADDSPTSSLDPFAQDAPRPADLGAGSSAPDSEARKLISALAGLVTAARPDLGVHAAPLRDGLQALQRAFREASTEPDAPGDGPGERLTGPV